MPKINFTRVPFACFVLFCAFFSFIVLGSGPMLPAFAGEPTPRPKPHAGSIISANGDAQVQFVEAEKWRNAEVDQDLLAGDGLRTGSLGTMALLFADRTQVRVQRNSILTVKSVVGSGSGKNTVLRLDRGGTWSRAVTGGTGVSIETPSATASIRGTDWSLTVDGKGSTRLIVLDGEMVLENQFGRVSVKRGEIAFAEIGKAPTKTILVNPQDREQQIYNLSLIDAMRFFKLTDLRVKERCQEKVRIGTVAAPDRTAGQWLSLAELSFDLGDWALTRQALQSIETTDAQLNARVALIAGYLAFFDYDFSRAEHDFGVAESSADSGRRLTALIGRAATLLKLRRSSEAESLVDGMEKEYGDNPRFLLFRAILTTFSGDFQEAIGQVQLHAKRFPDNPDFPAAEGILSIILGRADQAKSAADRTLALDPGYSIGYQVLSEYRQTYQGDSEGAIELVRQGLAINDKDNELWAQLGHIYLWIGEYSLAEEAFLESIALNAKHVACLANYAILLLEQYRINEARELLTKVEQVDPGRDFTRIFEGRIALQTDDIAGAQQSFLKATTLNPAYSDATLGLAYTYYQDGELAPARQALDNAARMDPNSPVIPLVGSVIASDRAYADQAIEYAREAIRLYRQRGGEGITGLASTRGGNNTLGSAYSDLGLNAWANYYNELSFDPYSAESHFYRARHAGGSLSSLYQGLLLEPLASASRNRFVDFFRRPFTDTELGGSVGWPGNGTSYGASVNVQGFSLAPKPMSYYLSVIHGNSPGDRENAGELSTSVIGALGVNITPNDRLFLDIEAVSSETELPGTVTAPDPDDESDDQLINAGLGYSHYFGARNIVLGRIMVQDSEGTVSNDDPLGTNLSSLEYSLVYNFGVEGARLLYALGLSDNTDPNDPDSPILTVGGKGPFLSAAIPPWLDEKQYFRFRVEDRSQSVNVRHMFNLESVDVSYGAEIKSFRQKTLGELLWFEQRDPGTGLISGPGGSESFLFGDPVFLAGQNVKHGVAGRAYLDALWRINQNIWLNGSLFADHADDDDAEPMNRLDPRAGLAWQVSSSDWLRLAFREDVGSSSGYSLAPVATVGLMPQTEFTSYDGRVASYIARWDREWASQFFTALELRRRDIHDFSINVPDSFMFYYVDKGRIDQASLSANLWLRGGLGLFARAVLNDTENRSDGSGNGESLPLIPDRQLDTGIAWIHPLQIRINLVVHLVDERPADVTGNAMLGGYETVDFSATWQPLALDKHLALGIAATNLFDRSYEVGTGMPARGRNVMATATWRF